jgi:hypothetical protein
MERRPWSNHALEPKNSPIRESLVGEEEVLWEEEEGRKRARPMLSHRLERRLHVLYGALDGQYLVDSTRHQTGSV